MLYPKKLLNVLFTMVSERFLQANFWNRCDFLKFPLSFVQTPCIYCLHFVYIIYVVILYRSQCIRNAIIIIIIIFIVVVGSKKKEIYIYIYHTYIWNKTKHGVYWCGEVTWKFRRVLRANKKFQPVDTPENHIVNIVIINSSFIKRFLRTLIGCLTTVIILKIRV